MISRLSILAVFIAGQLFQGCSKDATPCTIQVSEATLSAVNQTQLTADVKKIDDYLALNNIANVQQDHGLRYTITTNADGGGPCLESEIAVIYTGRLMSTGAIFDASALATPFTLNNLILGWRLGFLHLSPGDVATLYVPSGYAYGAVQQTKIPANSNLVFEVQLVSFSQPE